MDPVIQARDELRIALVYANSARIAAAESWPATCSMSPDYVAGLIDGEGHIGVNKVTRRNGRPQYQIRVQIGNTEPGLMQPIMAAFGGSWSVVEAQRWNKNARTCHKWQIHSRQAQRFILAILPHLRHPGKIKAAKACLMMEFLRKKAGGNKIDDVRVITSECLREIVLSANSGNY